MNPTKTPKSPSESPLSVTVEPTSPVLGQAALLINPSMEQPIWMTSHAGSISGATKRSLSPLELVIRLVRYAGIQQPGEAISVIRTLSTVPLKDLWGNKNTAWELEQRLAADNFFAEVELAIALMIAAGTIANSDFLKVFKGVPDGGPFARRFLMAMAHCRICLYEQVGFLDEIKSSTAVRSENN